MTQVADFLTCALNNLTSLTSSLPANHPCHCCRTQTFRDRNIVYTEPPIEVIKQGLKGMGVNQDGGGNRDQDFKGKSRMGTGTRKFIMNEFCAL